MVWEPPRVTTTTAEDGKTAAVLTFFLYRVRLSHVPRDIDNFFRPLQRSFQSFFRIHDEFVTRPL